MLFEEVMMEEYISIDNDILKLAYSELRILRDLVGEDDYSPHPSAVITTALAAMLLSNSGLNFQNICLCR